MAIDRSTMLYNEAKAAIMKLREVSNAEGILKPEVKATISAAIFAALRCEPCVKSYLIIAKELGASQELVQEVFALVINAQGCAGDVWVGRAISFFEGLMNGTVDPSQIMADLCEAVKLIQR